ncbi:ATP-dependent DNA ligase [Aquipuribacter sp. MA13-6]|uniref:ATP dependent DNA ligase n=1 Tax=unclassified Aquipuribacter TaxID=2635084 RepID=UPI003EEA4937
MTTEVTPMLPVAVAADELPSGPAWSHEVKWDGYRVLVRAGAARAGVGWAGTGRGAASVLRLDSRTGLDLTARFPALADLLDVVADGTVLDAEVVSMVGGRPDFAALASGDPSGTVRAVVFDVPVLAGTDVYREPLHARRQMLAGLDLPGCALRSEPFADGEALLAATRQQGLEGVVAKRLDSPYRPGVRSPDWRKHAHRRRRTVLVGGWRPAEGRSAQAASLLVGAPDAAGDLRFLGRAGSGITARSGAGLAERLGAVSLDAPPFVDEVLALDRRGVRWCGPVVAVEVAYRERTGSGRLRHPVVLGVREDAQPDPWEDA